MGRSRPLDFGRGGCRIKQLKIGISFCFVKLFEREYTLDGGGGTGCVSIVEGLGSQ